MSLIYLLITRKEFFFQKISLAKFWMARAPSQCNKVVRTQYYVSSPSSLKSASSTALFHSMFSPYWYKAIFLFVPDFTAQQCLYVALMISRLFVYYKQIQVSSSPWWRVYWTVIDSSRIKSVKMALGQKIQYFLKWHGRHVLAIRTGKGN